jgi:hypothetical protein
MVALGISHIQPGRRHDECRRSDRHSTEMSGGIDPNGSARHHCHAGKRELSSQHERIERRDP